MGISDNETTNSTLNIDRSNNELIKSKEVINVPVRIDEHSLIDGARQVLEVLRPTWESVDIQFKVSALKSNLKTLYNYMNMIVLNVRIFKQISSQ